MLSKRMINQIILIVLDSLGVGHLPDADRFNDQGTNTLLHTTVPEVIMANCLGIKVLGLSMITNMAAGISLNPLSHQEVIETSKTASPKFKTLVKGIIEQLNW
jgi:purine nucleoside phosphorylase